MGGLVDDEYMSVATASASSSDSNESGDDADDDDDGGDGGSGTSQSQIYRDPLAHSQERIDLTMSLRIQIIVHIHVQLL